jgi:hypothetical protein
LRFKSVSPREFRKQMLARLPQERPGAA